MKSRLQILHCFRQKHECEYRLVGSNIEAFRINYFFCIIPGISGATLRIFPSAMATSIMPSILFFGSITWPLLIKMSIPCEWITDPEMIAKITREKSLLKWKLFSWFKLIKVPYPSIYQILILPIILILIV